MALLDRFPILVWAGAGLLGWIAGEIMVKDTAVVGWLGADLAHQMEYWAAAAGACSSWPSAMPCPEHAPPAAEVTDV